MAIAQTQGPIDGPLGGGSRSVCSSCGGALSVDSSGTARCAACEAKPGAVREEPLHWFAAMARMCTPTFACGCLLCAGAWIKALSPERVILLFGVPMVALAVVMPVVVAFHLRAPTPAEGDLRRGVVPIALLGLVINAGWCVLFFAAGMMVLGAVRG